MNFEQIFDLGSDEEVRLELTLTPTPTGDQEPNLFSVELESGSAEIFGQKLVQNYDYRLQKKTSIFSFSGAKIRVIYSIVFGL